MKNRGNSGKENSQANSGAVTLSTIADLIGVNKSTVSAVLGNMPRAQRFTPELCERIKAEAKRLNYRPNFFASKMRGGNSKLILLGLGTFQDAHAAIIAEEFTHRAEELGYKVIMSVLDRMAAPHENVREILGPQGIKAYCSISNALDHLPPDGVAELVDNGVNVVLVSRAHDDPRVGQVLIDEEWSGRLAYEHLYSKGIRDIWIVTDQTMNPAVAGGRAQGAMNAALEKKAPEPRIIVIPNSTDFSIGYTHFQGVLKEGPPPEGIFAVRDVHAYGVIRALSDAGYCVGRDVAVIGHDDIWPSALTSPGLTTVRQPMRRMGIAAADMLIASMEEKPTEARVIKFRPYLVERDSVMKLSLPPPDVRSAKHNVCID